MIGALVCVMCVAMAPVMSQFQGFWRETRMPYPLIPGIPLNPPTWMSQQGFMGFPHSMNMMVPQPMWTGFQPWQQQTNWQTTLNNNNNLNPNNVAGGTTVVGQSGDPWETNSLFNTGVNRMNDGTMTGSNPIVSTNSINNGLSSKNYPWNTFATQSQNFPLIPNTVSRGPFVGGVNTMNTGNGGLFTSQFPATSFPQNNGMFGNNLNGALRNSQFLNNQNTGMTGSTPSSGFISNQLSTNQNTGLTGSTSNNGFTNNQFSSSSTSQNAGTGLFSQALGLKSFQK
ncbi:hypothetical protein ACF0H5_005227 [Mactra antiquata]